MGLIIVKPLGEYNHENREKLRERVPEPVWDAMRELLKLGRGITLDEATYHVLDVLVSLRRTEFRSGFLFGFLAATAGYVGAQFL